jgi:hypothetical protein
MLPNLPVVVIRLITILTDVYTLLHIKLLSKQCSTTYHEENHSPNDMCKICHTFCNNQSIDRQKLDIPFKSTSFSYIIFALLFISSSLQNFVLPYWFFYHIPIVLFFSQTVNIPLIVYLSRKNNFENMAAARQKTNSLAWNRTQNQQWELNCAREERNQAPTMPVLESSF